MQKITLNEKNLFDLINQNRYKVSKETSFLSRCIDGRYQDAPDLPALAIPGADAGELMLIYATGHAYGFEVDKEKAAETLVEVVGGEKNLRLHTDSHAHGKGVLAGCGHIGQATLSPAEYKIVEGDMVFIKDFFAQAIQKGATETLLQGDHQEGAVVLVKGNWGVLPQGKILIGAQNSAVQIFIFHQTLVNERHKVLAKKLIENKAVVLLPGCDSDYLYEIMSTIGDEHLMETARRLAKGLPIYEVTFDKNGGFEIENLGNV